LRRAAGLILVLSAACEAPAEPLEPLEQLASIDVPPIPALSAPVAPAPPCSAPSHSLRELFDARDEAALDRCVPLRSGSREQARACGRAGRALDLARLDAAVVPLDEAARAHVRAIAAEGRKRGRRAQAFGLVGDSMTISGDFLRDFSDETRVELTPEVAAALRIGDATIVEHYRGKPVDSLQGIWRDSFLAYRAAKSGMRAPWALAGAPSPLDQLIERVSPAIALVLFGGNDAAYRSMPLAELTEAFAGDLARIVDALEAAGIVPVLHTLARHGHAPGIDACGPRAAMTNWRIAVQTNALSARVIELACARRLPLIDLRHALDVADNRGLGPDGVHLAAHARGSAQLTAAGLGCGANVRNYITLKALAKLLPLVTRE
jgi:hypothetical protein